MRALLIGYGKMGKLIHQLAKEENVDVVGTLSSQNELSSKALQNIDVAIDFSSPNGILDRISLLAEHNVPLIIGTTGWNEEIEQARKIVNTLGGSCLYGSNFAIGVQRFMKLVRQASSLFSSHDVAIIEEHHSQKKDAPSGTAKELQRIVLEKRPDKKETLTIAASRAGFQPGKHALIFDGPDDTIELIHSARNRNGFARGALQATHWIQGKKGFFTVEDLL